MQGGSQYKLFKELLDRGYKVVVMELPDVVERVYNDLVFTWPGKFQFIYDEDHLPADVYRVNL